MIHPEEIRSLVRQGRIPENGRVVRGSALLAVRDLWIRAALFQFIGLATGDLISFILLRRFNVEYNFIYAVLLLIMDITFSFIQANAAKNSALVFLPDACVKFTDMRYNNPYTCKIVQYASISNIQLNLGFWTGPHLMVRDHEGKQRWYADPCYGDRGRTLQDILTAYNTYTVLSSAPYMALTPLPMQVQ